jgi:hypothetical protein
MLSEVIQELGLDPKFVRERYGKAATADVEDDEDD